MQSVVVLALDAVIVIGSFENVVSVCCRIRKIALVGAVVCNNVDLETFPDTCLNRERTGSGCYFWPDTCDRTVLKIVWPAISRINLSVQVKQ